MNQGQGSFYIGEVIGQTGNDIMNMRAMLYSKSMLLDDILAEDEPERNEDRIEFLIFEMSNLQSKIDDHEKKESRLLDEERKDRFLPIDLLIGELKSAVCNSTLKQSLDMINCVLSETVYAENEDFIAHFPPELITYVHTMHDDLFDSTLTMREIRREIDTAYQRVVDAHADNSDVMMIASTLLSKSNDILKRR